MSLLGGSAANLVAIAGSRDDGMMAMNCNRLRVDAVRHNAAGRPRVAVTAPAVPAAQRQIRYP
jgi:hypothetical protein